MIWSKPLPANTKARPKLEPGDRFVILWPERARRIVETGFENFWSHGDGHHVRISAVRLYPCGAVECRVAGEEIAQKIETLMQVKT